MKSDQKKMEKKKKKLKKHKLELKKSKLEKAERVLLSQNVDKNGIFYSIKRMPDDLKPLFDWAYDKRNEDWFIEEEDLIKAKKLIKRAGFKPKVLVLHQGLMSAGEALKEIGDAKLPRLKTKIEVLDKLLNGGFVKGSVTLVSGEPGAGKSTLATQLMLLWSKKKRCIYINTEENRVQIADRFKRINIDQPFNKKQLKNLLWGCYHDVNFVKAMLRKEDAEIIILDSLGGFVEAATNASRGGTKILKEAAGMIHDYVKENNNHAVAIMIGHVNKKGDIAGPEAMQHMADTVLFIQGSSRVRTIQPIKNRYGDTSGMVTAAMTERGLDFEDSQQVVRDVNPGQVNQVARIGDGWTEF